MAVAGQGMLTKEVCAVKAHTLLLLCLCSSFLMDRWICVRFWAKFKDFSPVSGMKRDSCMISCADPNMAYTVNKRRFQPFSDNAKRTNSYSRLFPRICYVILPALSIRTQGKQ